MKKLITLIFGVFTLLLVTLSTPNVHAVLLEHELDFNLLSFSATSDLRAKINTGENLYDKLDALFDLEPDQTYAMDVTIKRGALSYPGKISHWNHLTWGTLRYSILIEYSSTEKLSIVVFPDTVTLDSVYGGTINTNQASASVSAALRNQYSHLMGSYKILAMLEGELDPEEGTDITNFNELPSTLGTLPDAADSSMVGYVYFNHTEDDLFDTYVLAGGEQYNLGEIQLPGVIDLNKEPLSPGIYWTEGNKRYIYYEFQLPTTEIPLNEQYNMFIDDPSQINGFRPFVTMNLTDSTYVFTDKLKLYSGYYGGPNGQAYADVVFPMDIDDLLSIEMSYQFRWQILWGLAYTSWESQTVKRYINEVSDMKTTWDHIKSTLTFYNLVFEAIPSWIAGPSPTIQSVTVNSQYKADYTEKINLVRESDDLDPLTVDEIFPSGADVYRIYLNTFSDGRYTGFQIGDDIVIIDVLYKVDGEIFHVPYDDIDNDGSFGGGGPGLGGQDSQAWDWSWLTSLPDYVLIGGAVIIGLIILPQIDKTITTIKKIISDPKKLLIYGIIILAALYFLGFI